MTTVSVTMPGQVSNARLAVALAHEVGHYAGLRDGELEGFVLAVGEVAVNAALHGSGSRPEVPVQVDFKVTVRTVEVVVTDKGPGFDLRMTLASPGREALSRSGGRGLRLAMACVDRLTAARMPGGGQRVILVKSLSKGGDSCAQPAYGGRGYHR